MRGYKDEITAVSTFVIAVFTTILGVFTIFLARSTRLAAEASKAASDHIPRVERAYVFVLPHKIHTSVKLNKDYWIANCGLEFRNSGKTPGFIKRAYGEFSTAMPTADLPTYGSGKTLLMDTVIGGDGRSERGKLFESNIIEPHYFFGYIEYETIFKEVKITRFCFKIFPEQQRFNLAGPRSWNDWT